MLLSVGDYFAGFVAAFLASVTGSFAGGGSSLVMMPLLLMYVPGSYVFLLTVNKVRGLVMNGVSGGIHLKENKLSLRLLCFIVFFGLLGTAMGTYILEVGVNEELLSRNAWLVLLGTAFYLAANPKVGRSSKKKELQMTNKHWLVTGVFSFLLNIVSGLFGGTGIFMTGFLVVYLRMPFIKAAAHTMIIYLTLNFAQTLYFFFTVSVDVLLIAVVVLGAFFGSFCGTKLQYLEGNKWVRVGAVSMMVIVGFKLLLG